MKYFNNLRLCIATVCSCEICRGARYDRVDFKRETRRIIKESMD